MLASALVHVIVLVLLTFWGVSSSLSHWINERGGTRVALVSPAAGNELAAQIRGDLTGLRIEPPAAEPKSQLRTRSRPPIPLAVSAVLEVARSRLATNDVTRPEQLEDAPARARPTASTRPPPPVRNTHAVNVKLPPPVSRGREQEAARHISATPAVSSNARKHHSHASVFGPSPFAEESPGPAPLPNMAPDPASRVVAALSSHRISHPERPTLTPPRSLLPSRQTLPEIPPISTAPTSAQAEPVISARTDQPFSTKQDAGALHVADRPAEAIPRRVDPPPQTPVSGHAESSFAAATPAPSPSRTITAPPPPPQPVLPALAADTPVMPEHTHCASELTTAPPPSAIAGAARLRHHDHRTTPASHDPAIHDSGRPAPTPGRYPRLITSDSRDTDPDALPSASSARRPAGIVLAAVPPIPIGLPPVGDQSESVATGEQTLAVAPDDTRFSHRRRTSNTGMLSRASSSLPFRLDPSSPAIPDDHPRSALSFPVSDTQARRAPRSDSLSSSTPVSLPRLVFELSAVEPSRPAHRLESTFSSSTPQAIRARRALRTRTNGNLHVAPQVPLPAAASIRRVALPDESRRFTELPRPDIAPAGDQSGLFAFTSTQPAQPPAIRFPADLPLLPDEAPAVAPERAAVDITGAVRGMVRDARTGEPLADVTVRLDLADRPAIAVITGPQGDYLLLTPPVPDFVALSASHEGYVPETVNIAADELDHAIVTRDFRLSPKQKDIIALEADPDVHHLGDDRFTGRINSRFQKRSEGRRYAGVFELAADQLPRSEGQAKVLFLVRGAQRNNRIRINDQLLDTRLNRAPRDGSFGPFQATFPASWLREGTNTLEIRSVYGGSDYDDFEFVNIRIRLPGVD
ncbi:MAG: hypothetical protein SYC29_14480 [Planctomycetota bacterium]|nr:hypothetical protein [Planctomycetota bacterium]